MTKNDQYYEHRSLQFGIWINLIMGLSGVVFSFLSNSDALLVDGLFSFINFGSTIIAGHVTLSIARKPDRLYPFGYDANETIYIMFRSLAIVGMLAFAFLNSLSKIIGYLFGESVPELHFTPILIYTLMMVVLCFGLAYWHFRNWKATNRRSDVLKTECTASMVDGFLSAGAGTALLAVTLLRGTPLECIIPISDALVVVILTAIMISRPAGILIQAVREVAGRSDKQELVDKVHKQLNTTLADTEFELLELSVTKLGRTRFIVVYINAKKPVSAEKLDEVRTLVRRDCSELVSPVKTEIVFTATKPW